MEPILGVSIEEYKEVPPEKAKGYDFSDANNPNAVVEKPEERIHSPEGIEVKSLTETSSTSKLLFLFFMFLPIIASGFAFFKVSRKDHSNVVSLEELRNRKGREEEKNDDIPKAS
ncbi:hypothetical protein [Bacteriovorax sp. Seq25_V]|uniref:hypothetical protein n=1 Tax=Bacteriovorax sp. Seq25_V TaxID=1201288 RepID=UPI0004188D0D|nr:hypothetical protein [Bacteriovorax sp. Seq25_V]